MQTVNPSQHSNDANNENQNFEDSSLLIPTDGRQTIKMQFYANGSSITQGFV